MSPLLAEAAAALPPGSVVLPTFVVVAVGSFIATLMSALAFMFAKVLAAHDKTVEAMKAGMAAKEQSDKENRESQKQLSDAIVANTKACEAQTEAVRSLKETGKGQTEAIDRVNESVTGIIRDAIARRSSSQTQQAVK